MSDFENADEATRYYVRALQAVVEEMQAALAKGELPEHIAKTRRDFEQATGAYADADLHLFAPAWDAFPPTYLDVWNAPDNLPLNRSKYLPAQS